MTRRAQTLEWSKIPGARDRDASTKVSARGIPVTLAGGEVLYSPGVPIARVYFPVSSLVGLQYSTREDGAIEIGVVGSDGVVGITSLLGGSSPAHHAIVQVGGDALRIDAETLAQVIESSEPPRRALLRYAHALMTQIGQVAVCNSVHSLQQRVCRWLLVCRDRLDSIEIPTTQGVLASLLGVRRESVCHVATALQNDGLLSYVRGHVHTSTRCAWKLPYANATA